MTIDAIPLSQRAQLAQFETEGLVGPVPAFDEMQVEDFRRRFTRELPLPTEVELPRRVPLPLDSTRNRHLDVESVAELIWAEAMRTTTLTLLGRDTTLWRSQFFFGLPGAGVRWHRDEYQTLLDTATNQISIHLGLSVAIPANCVSVIPGSHRLSDDELEARHGLRRIETEADRAYGTPQYEEVESGVRGARMMLLKPGEYFAFHPRLVHASIDIRPPAVRRRAARVRGVRRRLAKVTSAVGGGWGAPVPRWGIALRVAGAGVEASPGAWAQTPEGINEVRPYT